ncbi:hypothetical protein IAR50_002484 [Cryptococcus sp. DSM 104548]
MVLANYSRGEWRGVAKRLCERKNLWSRGTTLHPVGSSQVTKYQDARQALRTNKRKNTEDDVFQPLKFPRSGESSVSREEAVSKSALQSKGTASTASGASDIASSPLFNYENINQFLAPTYMAPLVPSSRPVEHDVETTIFNPLVRRNDPE